MAEKGQNDKLGGKEGGCEASVWKDSALAQDFRPEKRLPLRSYSQWIQLDKYIAYALYVWVLEGVILVL